MTVAAVDHRNPPELRVRAHAEVAQYLRPKLKSVEFVVDPQGEEARAEREALAARLVELLDAGAAAKRATIVEGTSRDVSSARADASPEQDSGDGV